METQSGENKGPVYGFLTSFTLGCQYLTLQVVTEEHPVWSKAAFPVLLDQRKNKLPKLLEPLAGDKHVSVGNWKCTSKKIKYEKKKCFDCAGWRTDSCCVHAMFHWEIWGFFGKFISGSCHISILLLNNSKTKQT